MASKIISMGKKHGPAPAGATVIEVTNFANPYAQKSFRDKTGFDAEVGAYIKRNTEDFEGKEMLLEEEVLDADGEVYLACIGGKHRSVFLTELIGKRLGLPVAHRDLNKR